MTSDADSVVAAGDSLVRLSDFEWAVPDDFRAPKLVILIHGFMSHGKYLRRLGGFLESSGYRVFIFNHNPCLGIHRASQALNDFMVRYDHRSKGAVSHNKVSLVAHSMGGLVARHLVRIQGANKLVKGIVMLGTPSNGCFSNARFLSYLIDYGENLSDIMPQARNPACLTARELMRVDVKGGTTFIDSLNETWGACDPPPAMTISGGKNKLEICRNPLWNLWANRFIQRLIGRQDNDGLVTEASVDMRNSTRIAPEQRYTHFNEYPYYRELNHTYLKENQTLALEIADWLDGL
jgi:pimeloyl-ACP methyl ester carboxylesterase